jgi:hypothetical protein
MRVRRMAPLAAALAAMAAVGATLFLATPTQAASTTAARAVLAAVPAPAPMVIDLKCSTPNSTDVLKFTPPLTLVVQPTLVQKSTSYTPCAAPTAPNLTSGSLATSSTINDACPMVLLSGTVVQTVTWNTGQTTTMTLNRTATISGTTLTVSFTGTVTGGLFLGRNVRQTYTASAVDLINCLNGVGSVATIKSRVDLLIYH